MSPLLLSLTVFAAVVLALLGLYSLLTDLVLRDRARASRRVDEAFRKRQREQIQRSALFKDLGKLSAEVRAEDADFDGRPPSLRERFTAMIEQSGIDVTPGRLLMLVALGGLLGALPPLILGRRYLFIPLTASAGAALPYLFVFFRYRARMDKLLAQLPDAFDLMARVIRAGQTMSQALLSVADEFEQPVAGEFAYSYEQQNLGLPLDVSLRDLARRTGLVEMKIFVLALIVQRQTGGNLAEMLDKLAGVVRERFRLRGKIKALTAEGRAQAVLLLALPIIMLAILAFMSDIYSDQIARHPNLIAVMLGIEAVGALWIRRIVNFDF